jgi:hypothetical protein
MTLTQSQKHWRAWVKALQTRDASVRAEALDQLSRFLDYWTADLYIPAPFRGVLNGHDTPPPESWDEVFDVDAELLIRSKRPPHVQFGSNESWVCLCASRELRHRLDLMGWTSGPPNHIMSANC